MRGKPCLLTARDRNQEIVRRASIEARKEGVYEGCPLALAQALAPHAQVEKHDPGRERTLLYKLAEWSIRFAPYVGLDPCEELQQTNYGITLNITGMERYHQSEQLLAENIIKSFAAQGFYAKVAIAPTLGAAWALSRYWRERISKLDAYYYPLTELPVRALRVTKETESVLLHLGIKTIQDLLLLPRASLGERFGNALLERLNQAFGKADEPFISLQPSTQRVTKKAFETPITSQQILVQAVQLLFNDLLKTLAHNNESALSYLLELERIDSDWSRSSIRKELSLFSAQGSAGALHSIIESLCEKIHAPNGIQSITLHALAPSPCQGTPRNLFTATLEDTARSGEELLNYLLVRLGRSRVRKVHFVASHIPERSFEYEDINTTAMQLHTGRAFSKQCSSAPAIQRPSYLLRRPEALHAIALLPDNPPSRMYWQGEELKIIRGIGPERICDQWWSREISTEIREREYFRVQESSGRWLWVFRKRRTMEWFVHGIWI